MKMSEKSKYSMHGEQEVMPNYLYYISMIYTSDTLEIFLIYTDYPLEELSATTSR